MEKNETKSISEKFDSYNFEMFSKPANDICITAIKKIHEKISGPMRITKDEVISFVIDELKSIEKNYAEVFDTEPNWHFADLTTKICNEYGYNYKIERHEIC